MMVICSGLALPLLLLRLRIISGPLEAVLVLLLLALLLLLARLLRLMMISGPLIEVELALGGFCAAAPL